MMQITSVTRRISVTFNAGNFNQIVVFGDTVSIQKMEHDSGKPYKVVMIRKNNELVAIRNIGMTAKVHFVGKDADAQDAEYQENGYITIFAGGN